MLTRFIGALALDYVLGCAPALVLHESDASVVIGSDGREDDRVLLPEQRGARCKAEVSTKVTNGYMNLAEVFAPCAHTMCKHGKGNQK